MKNKLLLSTILCAVAVIIMNADVKKENKTIKIEETETQVITEKDNHRVPRLVKKKEKIAKQERIIKKVLERDQKRLIAKQDIRNKAILTQEERQELEDYLTNPKNIRLAYKVLTAKNFEDFDKTLNTRIDATNFLMEGLSKTDMNRETIFKTVEQFLLNDIEESVSNIDERRVIIGDKVDLYYSYLKYAPERIETFKSHYMGERLKKIIKYVEINVKRSES
ncbi:hypothetical protein [Bacteriovorax sp. DB6_IX]|uniref:hypothetical protein n=1 Tax=Bacteriovorax sp. DB6_IX TaxID=1353530 RepID=UPI000389FFA0|nr:hypothetical protein [Bacteriovorax sp. DB6_IX]EQC50982.1 hypothetical protein M901_1762 [Bacteriovorax sp. DB6_IX]